MVLHPIIANISAIPKERIVSCDFIVITHYLPNTNYVFSYKQINDRLKPISIYLTIPTRNPLSLYDL